MAESACPKCNTEISPDVFERTEGRSCPFCGSGLELFGSPRAENWGPEGTHVDQEPTGHGVFSRPLPPLPAKSRLQVVESTPERLILFIPAGGVRTRGAGVFALCWNAFMVVATTMTIFGKPEGGGEKNWPFLIAILSLFWIIGAVLAVVWIRMKFERTLLLLEPERLVVQQILFDRKRNRETSLRPESRAELATAYEVNDEPVYRIEIKGTNGVAKFGTPLQDEEKNWLVDRINEFLDPAGPDESLAVNDTRSNASSGDDRIWPTVCSQCGAPLAGKPARGVLVCAHCGATHRGTPAPPGSSDAEVYEPLTPHELPPGCGVEILSASPECLRFQFGLGEVSLTSRIVPLFLLAFAIGWYSFIFIFLSVAANLRFGFSGILFGLFMIPFVLAGLVPLGIGLYALIGKTTIELTRERLSVRWWLGPLGHTRSLPVDSLDAVGIERSIQTNPRIRGRERWATNRSVLACIARGGGQKLVLSFLQDEPLARRIACLVRTRLEELGHPVP